VQGWRQRAVALICFGFAQAIMAIVYMGCMGVPGDQGTGSCYVRTSMLQCPDPANVGLVAQVRPGCGCSAATPGWTAADTTVTHLRRGCCEYPAPHEQLDPYPLQSAGALVIWGGCIARCARPADSPLPRPATGHH